jgi:hypothetical protein
MMNTTEVGSEEWRAHHRTLTARYVAHQGPRTRRIRLSGSALRGLDELRGDKVMVPVAGIGRLVRHASDLLRPDPL